METRLIDQLKEEIAIEMERASKNYHKYTAWGATWTSNLERIPWAFLEEHNVRVVLGWSFWPLYIRFTGIDKKFITEIKKEFGTFGWKAGEVDVSYNQVSFHLTHEALGEDLYIVVTLYSDEEKDTCRLVPIERRQVVREEVTYSMECKE